MSLSKIQTILKLANDRGSVIRQPHFMVIYLYRGYACIHKYTLFASSKLKLFTVVMGALSPPPHTLATHQI